MATVMCSTHGAGFSIIDRLGFIREEADMAQEAQHER